MPVKTLEETQLFPASAINNGNLPLNLLTHMVYQPMQAESVQRESLPLKGTR